MANGLNRVYLMGNLGADPELRGTNSGSMVLNLRMATTETWLDRDRVKQERTEWHSVVVFGARAEPLSKILHKGSRVFIEGGLRTTSWEKDGQKHYKTEVVAREVILADSRPTGPGRSPEAPWPARDPTTGEVFDEANQADPF